MDKKGHFTVYFNSIIRELTIKDRMGFKEIFWMSVENFELVLKYTDNIRSLGNMCKNLTDVTGDGMLDKNSFQTNSQCILCWMKQKMLDERLFLNNLSSNITFRHPNFDFFSGTF